MTVRLVYSPKVYAYTKNAQGEILDISPYIVSGQVERNINAVSSATLVLRNPDKIFTSPKEAGAAFHPQDPITIYMERLAGYPVRVFTGYLDTTPYFQLQPGVVELQASCTLKRLIHTYFDPSLPYMNAFLAKYKWLNTFQGSIVSEASMNSEKLKNASTKLEDGSVSRLLWGILYDIAEWRDTDIYIEPLPQGANGIVRRVLKLMKLFDEANEEAAQELESFFNSILGTRGAGGRGGNTIDTSIIGSTNIAKSMNFLMNNGYSAMAAAGAVGNWDYESGQVGVDPHSSGTNAYGIMQWTPASQLIDWCNGHNPKLDYTELSSQLQYAIVFVSNDILTQLNAATTPEQAAHIYFLEAEEPGLKGTSISEQDKYGLQKRMQFARQIYNGVSKSTKNSSPSIQDNSITNRKMVGPNGTFETYGTIQGTSDNSSAFTVMIEAANAIANNNYPYKWGGGHGEAGTPSLSPPGYDCSGAVAAVLHSAGLYNGSLGDDYSLIQSLLASKTIVPGRDNSSTSVTIWDNPHKHIFMNIGGTQGYYWGTSDGHLTSSGGSWLGKTSYDADSGNFTPYHIPSHLLSKQVKYRLKIAPGSPNMNDASGGGNGNDSSTITHASAEAFAQQIDFPTVQDTEVAIMLGAEGKGLMHDQVLLPFVQQVCQASMRNFMSLPDGSFYAFYPDYFGEMGHHNPYWLIDDIEITSGTINMSDDTLSTHVYAVGDNTFPADISAPGSLDLANELFSTGTITVYNAFESTGVIENGTDKSGLGTVMGAGEAIDFVKRYGARPLVQDFPMVRSGIFEMLMAYQLFMESWSSQSKSIFTFTFMPELFPGGKVGFPQHGLMMYVNQVTHTFDYVNGFDTTAQLSSPSLMPGANSEDTGLPPNMVAALAEPVRSDPTSHTPHPSKTKKKNPKPKRKKPAPPLPKPPGGFGLPTHPVHNPLVPKGK